MSANNYKSSTCSFVKSKRAASVFFALLASLIATSVQAENQPPTIAIIIDDMGNHRVQGERLIDLPYPLTLAFLPYRKHTGMLARKAFRQEKEIMLHAPMENTLGLPLGAGALTSEMSEERLKQTLRDALATIPYVQGVNNHMGSRLTQQALPMTWVMEELNRHPLYFVDSRTIASSVAANISREQGIPTLARDVFLDHILDTDAIDYQFKKLLGKAKANGFALAIGHPHQVTVDYLEKILPTLDEQGFAIATASGLWTALSQGQPMFGNNDKRLIVDNLIAKRTQLNRNIVTQ